MNDDLLSVHERHILLEDISRVGLILGRDISRPVSVTAQSSPRQAKSVSLLERLSLLETSLPRIETALASIARSDSGSIRSKQDRTPLLRSLGRADAARAIATDPALVALWRELTDLNKPVGANDIHETTFVEKRIARHVETPANLLATWLLEWLWQESRNLQALCSLCADREAEHRAARVVTALLKWRRRSPFEVLKSRIENKRDGYSHLINQVRSPAARSLFDIWRQLRGAFRFDWSESPLLHMPAAKPWLLYEIWCLFMTAAAIRNIGWLAVESSLFRLTPDGMHLKLIAGQGSEIRFRQINKKNVVPPIHKQATTLSLVYRPWFSSVAQRGVSSAVPPHGTDLPARGGFRSRTHAMQPDIALERPGNLLLLDAKYRSYSPQSPDQTGGDHEFRSDVRPGTNPSLLDDLDKMHAYRDAIMIDAHPAVQGAWCLFPGDPNQKISNISFPASTPECPFGTAQIGAVRLRPGEAKTYLENLIYHWMFDTGV